MAVSAEQDNQVKILNGTAAVCAEDKALGENRSLGKPGKADLVAERLQPLLQARVRRPTESVSSALCVIMGGAFVAEKRLWHPRPGAAALLFLEEFV